MMTAENELTWNDAGSERVLQKKEPKRREKFCINFHNFLYAGAQ
jgi:hypothetical protein